MLKVKKAIYNPSTKAKDQFSQLQNDIKNSIKKKGKTINQYASLISEIKKEYNMLHKENQDLKA